MSYFYCIILLFFLLLYSLLITWQLYNFIILIFFSNRSNILRVKQIPDTKLGNSGELFYSLKKLSSKKSWFDSLLLLESQLSLPIDIKHSYFNAVGVIYNKMNQDDLAELYFLCSLLENNNYTVALRNLSRLKK